MAGIQQIGFLPPDLMAEQQGIERKRRLAEAMLMQGMQPHAPGQMVSGYFVRSSPLEGLARLFQTYAGMKGQEGADRANTELYQRAQAARMQALQRLGPNPTPQALMQSQDPMLQQYGMQAYAKGMEPYTLKPEERRMQGSQVVAEGGPAAFTIGPDQVRMRGAEVIAKGPPKEDDFTRALRTAGIDPSGPEGQRLARAHAEKLATHAPAPNVRVDVKTGESLGKEIGPMVAESRAGALGALQTAEISQRIRNALAGGNVTVGPTANIRNTVNQFAQVLGVGGKDNEERLVNTRNVIRGLAQATIAARKQLKGQGQVSDFEGKLLQKAESGDIDSMTIPELKSFVDLSERLAKLQYGLHTHNLDVMRKRPDLQNLLPFYEVPQWGAFNAPPQGGQGKVIDFNSLPSNGHKTP